MDLPSSLVCQSSRRGIFKHIFGTGAGRKVGEALEDITCCLAVALMYYTVFFRDPLGAIFASLVSFLLMKPLVDWLERHTHQMTQRTLQNQRGQAQTTAMRVKKKMPR